MKKHLFLTALVLALVMCFSLGVCAHDIITEDDGSNKYELTAAVQEYSKDNLWIGTLDAWTAAGKTLQGKTVLANGEAIHGDDIIMTNGKIVIALAVETRNPWGYPAGSILDAGYCVNGAPARDTVWAIEFLADRWDSWAPENCGTVKFDLVKYDFGNGEVDAVKVTRIYDQQEDTATGENYPEFDVVTWYGLGEIEGEDIIYMFTQLTNKDATYSAKLRNDIAMTNKGDDGGFMFNKTATHIAGNYGEKTSFSAFMLDPDATDAEWADGTAYDKGSVGYKELARNHTYAPGETKLYRHYVVLDNEPSTAAVIKVQNKLEGYTADQLQTVTLKSEPGAVVVIENADGKDLGWFICDNKGEAKVTLPKGEYKAFVECAGYAPGESVAITGESVAVARGEKLVKVTFNLKDEKGNAVYGRIDNGAYPTVRYCGESIYLDYVAEGDAKGVIEAYVAPGEYEVVVYGEGFWFYSEPQKVTGNTNNAKDLVKDVTVKMVYDAPEGYLSGDLHHHANKNDAFADPSDAIPSLMASGVDVAFITDHDFTVNNALGYDLAGIYGMEGFLPSEEISCSWAHFNVIPLTEASYEYFLDKNQENHIMDQFGKLPDFVKQTHEKEAAITANHPWYDYGLFTNKHKAPGGYTDDYDTVEINACDTPASITNTILSTADLWTGYVTGEEDDFFGEVNKAHYLVGGSDTHDVLISGFADADYENTLRSSTDYVSGKVRTFAYVGETKEGNVMENGLAFGNAVVAGNSFTTFGPLLTADKLPGEAYFDTTGKFELKVNVESLENIDDILVMSNFAEDTYTHSVVGEVPYIKALSKEDVNAKTATFELSYTAEDLGWIAILVIDDNGSIAITNPYWVGNTFADIDPAAWYFDAVIELQDAGIVNGNEKGLFEPGKEITRGEFAQMLYKYGKANNAFEGVTPKELPDVKDKKAWYYEAATTMTGAGIINGCADGNFNANNKISRAEMAVMIYRFLGLDEMFDAQFPDVQPSSWYYNAVTVLGGLDIVNGVGNGLFAPAATADKASAAQIIVNVIEFLK